MILRDKRMRCQEKSDEAFFPSSTNTFHPPPSVNEDEEMEVVFPSTLASLKRSHNFPNNYNSSLSISSSSSSDLSSSSEEEEDLEKGCRSLPESPESGFNKEEVVERN